MRLTRLIVPVGTAVALGVGAIWLTRSDDPGEGVVTLRGAAGTTAPEAAPAPVVAERADPTGLGAAMRSETRDLLWASRSEAALAGPMGRFAFLAAPPEIRCAATLCEVRGTTAAASTDAAKLAWQEIEQYMEGDALSPAGLIAADKVFGAGGDPYAFAIYYRREDSLLQQP